MSVNNVGANYPNYSTYLAEKNKPVNQQNKTEQAVSETNPEAADVKENVSADGDKYVPSEKTEYKTDFDKVNAMKSSLWHKVDAFEKLVNAMFQKQGIQYDASLGMKKNLENMIASGGVSEAERLQAQEAISEDGEWGVEKTAGRILDFAKALSGGDPSKIGLLKDAVIKGFKEAEKTWGGKLPDISQKTYDRIMQGFDEWEKSSQAQASTATETE